MSSDQGLEGARNEARTVYHEKDRYEAIPELTGMMGAKETLEHQEKDAVDTAYELINEYGHNLEEDDNRANKDLGWSLAQARDLMEREPSTDFEKRAHNLLESLDRKICRDQEISGTVQVYATMHGQGKEMNELTE
ncbi:MAG: hypothetical protein H8Z69_02425 [Nanohaloarchaea archaeon]|nr:hypothetical protein [Candidatus Nanohaloarchaea archaeon]